MSRMPISVFNVKCILQFKIRWYYIVKETIKQDDTFNHAELIIIGSKMVDI